ncbi:MAG: tRNA (adenosine(37)-N6)-threonylcarbamoyltransferase complex ATPase subunit type 1 TsaE [Patescibacteria group bacterium]
MRRSSLQSDSESVTEGFGEKLAPELLGQKTFLFGELGVGKTTFIRGLAKGLGVRTKIKSPTFVGEHIHAIPGKGNLIHLDFYRAESLEVEKAERLQELFSGNETIVVEWGERLPKKLLPKERAELRFKELRSGERKINFAKFP